MKELLVIGILTIILSSCSSTLQHDVIEINSDGKKIYNGQEVKSALSNYVSSEKVVIEVTRDVPFSAVRSTMEELKSSGIQNFSVNISSTGNTLHHDVIEINSDGKKIYNGQEVKSALSNYVSSEKVVIEVSRDVPFSEVRSTMEELKSNGIQNISITTLSKK